jgi:hypothetical protein
VLKSPERCLVAVGQDTAGVLTSGCGPVAGRRKVDDLDVGVQATRARIADLLSASVEPVRDGVQIVAEQVAVLIEGDRRGFNDL